MPPNGGSKASGNGSNSRRLQAQERVNRALELRKAGATFQAIAEQCGYKNAQRAHQAVTKAIRDLPREAAEDVRQIEVERLDRLMLGAWDRARRGDIEAGNYVLRIMKRRADLLGLDTTPARAEPEPPEFDAAKAKAAMQALYGTEDAGSD